MRRRWDVERNRAISLGLIVAGLVVFLAGALADVIGYGGRGVGARQITVMVVGAVVVGIGFLYQRLRNS